MASGVWSFSYSDNGNLMTVMKEPGKDPVKGVKDLWMLKSALDTPLEAETT